MHLNNWKCGFVITVCNSFVANSYKMLTAFDYYHTYVCVVLMGIYVCVHRYICKHVYILIFMIHLPPTLRVVFAVSDPTLLVTVHLKSSPLVRFDSMTKETCSSFR